MYVWVEDAPISKVYLHKTDQFFYFLIRPTWAEGGK